MASSIPGVDQLKLGVCVACILSYVLFPGCVTTVFVFLTNTASSSEEVKANALRSAILTFRLRQLQTIVQSLPVDQRPKTMTELKDLLHKHNTLQVSSPQDLPTCAKKNLQCVYEHAQHSVNPCTYEY